jgi:hypothetical protein
MKIRITESQERLLMELVVESDFSISLKSLRRGDQLVVTQPTKEMIFTVVDVFSGQVSLKSGGRNFITTDTSLRGGRFELYLVKKGSKQRIVLKNVDDIKIVRDGTVIDSFVSNIGRSQEKLSSIKVKKQKGKERIFDFADELRQLTVSDELILITGFINQNTGEIIESESTKITFIVEDIKANEYKLEFDSAVGPESENYNELSKYDELYIGLYSLKMSSGGDAIDLVLKTKLDGKEGQTFIHGVVTTDIVKGGVEDVEVSAEEILNNPILRKALLRQPNLLAKLMGKKEAEGLIPLMNRLQKLGLVDKDGDKISTKLKKGNKVKLKYLSKDIGLQAFNLKKGSLYRGIVKDEKTLTISSTNRKNKFIITLGDSKNDIYNVDIVLTTVKNGEVLDKDYKGRIKIIDYNYI